ncbi:MAG: polyhydroxyalkanoate synthesis regulator DNA-binding domain-containing protein [Anaerolineae bacterium]
MRLIKKYPNRKFYDMEDKRYVALEDISSLVKVGEEIQVVDSKSGQDITTLVLSQILREQERKGSFLPQALLTALVRRGSSGLKQVRKSLEASLKALQVLEDDVQEKLDALVERGEISQAESQELREELLARARHSQTAIQDRILKEIEASLIRLGVPSRSDVDGLNSQLLEIESKVDSLLSDLE